MTKREAALKSCKDRLEHLEKAPSHHYGKRQRQRAIELEKVKIEALLHQIWEEKLWHDAKTDPPKTPGLYYGKKTIPTLCIPVCTGTAYGYWMRTHRQKWTLLNGRIIRRL